MSAVHGITSADLGALRAVNGGNSVRIRRVPMTPARREAWAEFLDAEREHERDPKRLEPWRRLIVARARLWHPVTGAPTQL